MPQAKKFERKVVKSIVSLANTTSSKFVIDIIKWVIDDKEYSPKLDIRNLFLKDNEWRGKGISLDKSQAKLLVAHIKEIEEFADSDDEEEKPKKKTRKK